MDAGYWWGALVSNSRQQLWQKPAELEDAQGYLPGAACLLPLEIVTYKAAPLQGVGQPRI